MVAKFPNPHQVVIEIENDVPACDREPWEEHIPRCSRDMQGATGSAENDLQIRGDDIGAGGTRCQIEVTRSRVGNGSGRFW